MLVEVGVRAGVGVGRGEGSWDECCVEGEHFKFLKGIGRIYFRFRF